MTLSTCLDDDVLQDYLDEILPPAERAHVAAHLDQCSFCQDRTAQYGDLFDRLAAGLGQSDGTVNVEAALAEIRQTPEYRRAFGKPEPVPPWYRRLYEGTPAPWGAVALTVGAVTLALGWKWWRGRHAGLESVLSDALSDSPTPEAV